MLEYRQEEWVEMNQKHLSAALDRVRCILLAHGEGKEAPLAKPPAAAPPAAAALDTVGGLFGLSPFERDIILLCAGPELDAGFGALLARAQGEAGRRYPTFSLALAALPEPHWSAIVPAAPLRYWRLIEIAPGETLTTSPLRLDERILHYLAGVSLRDERLIGLVEPVPVPDGLADSHRRLADRVAARLGGNEGAPGILLCGPSGDDAREIAAAACARAGVGLERVDLLHLPADGAERRLFVRLWEREAILTGSVLLLDGHGLESAEAARAAQSFIEQVRAPLIVAARQPLTARGRVLLRLDVPPPPAPEQLAAWERALGPRAGDLNGRLPALVAHFRLPAGEISAAAHAALMEAAGSEDLSQALWEVCRVRARVRLDGLAQRIEPAACWEDLVLPEAPRRTLREIAAHVRQRGRVYEDWGFAAAGSRGLGISALFSGPSGTGKTMAAEVLAGELRLDLFRIDLSAVVSKYIGETEKNLRRVFDAAEAGGAVLLFDEADALFGKRSEVRDSHDRYANIEVSYLLQRMESYRGLAILTTNLKQALDPAFLRRIRFIVHFPFPDREERAAIWQRIFPPGTPTGALDVDRLARLQVTGGNIRNIALAAAFLAADQGVPVSMRHLLQAARSEYGKLERPLTPAEVSGWV